MKPRNATLTTDDDQTSIENELALLGCSLEMTVRLTSLSFWLRTWKPDWVVPFPDGTHFRLLFFND